LDGGLSDAPRVCQVVEKWPHADTNGSERDRPVVNLIAEQKEMRADPLDAKRTCRDENEDRDYTPRIFDPLQPREQLNLHEEDWRAYDHHQVKIQARSTFEVAA
jgi:hypothetical protein